ncbi:MAG: hypothetical protein EA376_13575 [Phycisphaeraceae bacterium]|nr:MAG: hypothetical protein EA376_13575 [Phycisphaeraceae bacterium]
MISFAVYDDDGPASEWPLRHAHLLGPEGVVVAGEIAFENGVIHCEKRNRASAALGLQYTADGPGVYILETCLLPDREEPYLLSLELARRRIMLFLVKLEEWGLFDLPPTDPVMTAFEQARQGFTKALVVARDTNGRHTIEQDRLARKALWMSIDASEQLSLRRADRNASRRTGAECGQTAPLILGCTIHTDRFTEPLRNVVKESFDFITLPMRWSELEPEEGDYNFARTDKWIEWAVRQARIPVVGGPLVEFRPRCVPDWLYIWENDYDTLRELIYEHVRRVVTRYRRVVSKWTVASGLHLGSNFSLSLEQIIDLTRLCVLMVRKLHPSARIQVEISQPFGEHSGADTGSIPPLLYTELMFQAGIEFDSLGLRLQMGDPEPGRATRDIMQIADLLDRFACFEKPLTISSFGAPTEPPDEESLGLDRAFDPGYWRGEWSEATQAEWLTNVVRIAYSNPAVTSVCWHELCDKASHADIPSGGLVTDAGRGKLALKRMGELHRRLRERRTLSDLDPIENGAARQTA